MRKRSGRHALWHAVVGASVSVSIATVATEAGAQDPVAAPSAPASVQSSLRPDEPFMELPILTWQEQAELETTVRQVIFNAYLPLLARPTFYRGVHDDTVPNQVGDWNWQRDDVKQQLLQRAGNVDAQRRAHAALPDAEINALIGKKQAFRPEQLEPLITRSPRFEDLSVTMRRVQPLGGDWYRVDFDVKTKVNGVVETTSFDSIDINRQGGAWLLPMRIILEVAPLARIQQSFNAAGPTDFASMAGNFLLLAESQLESVLPIDIPSPANLLPR
jgi:hypothetical protein